MPTVSSSDGSDSSAVEAELARLVRALVDPQLTGDDLYQAFQEIDPRRRGYVTSKSDVLDVLCDAIAPKHQSRLDFERIFDGFCAKKRGSFDYAGFCEAFDRCRASREPRTKTRSSSTAGRRSTSPLKSPTRRRHVQQQSDSTSSDADATQPTMRVDPRLETQRLLSRSIRQKLLHGVLGSQFDGFQGVQETLFHLDEAGDGVLDSDVFERKLLRRLKKPLTRQETDFLLANLRGSSSSSSSSSSVHYEQLASFCNIDSDASADETEERSPENGAQSPTRQLDPSQSLGGADFFAAEKRLRDFFQQPWQARSKHTSSTDTPRSIVTGAEAFLELTESIDRAKTGFLNEDDCQRIFTKLSLEITPSVARSVLVRFSRSSDRQINYMTFLERYGENPQHARERRKLKRQLCGLISTLERRQIDDWMQYLASRFEKYDARLHKRVRGDIPEHEFISVLSRSPPPVRIDGEAAAATLAQFLRVSRSSTTTAITYHEFLRILRDCQALQVALKLEVEAGKPTSTASQLSPAKPTPAHPGPSVADYLIHSASADERRYFEELMGALHKFQRRIQKTPVGNGVVSTATAPQPPGKPQPTGEKTVGITPLDLDAVKTLEAGAITPIDNGIMMALGAKLQVRIQFTASTG